MTQTYVQIRVPQSLSFGTFARAVSNQVDSVVGISRDSHKKGYACATLRGENIQRDAEALRSNGWNFVGA